MAITLPADPNIPSTVDGRMSKRSTSLPYFTPLELTNWHSGGDIYPEPG